MMDAERLREEIAARGWKGWRVQQFCRRSTATKRFDKVLMTLRGPETHLLFAIAAVEK